MCLTVLFGVKLNTSDIIYLLPNSNNTFEKTLQYIHFIEKDMTLVIKSICAHLHFCVKILFFNG